MVARVPVSGGAVERLAEAPGVVYDMSVGKGGSGFAVVASTPACARGGDGARREESPGGLDPEP